MGTHLNTTWHHIRRSPYQAFAAVFIMMQTFFVISLFTFVIVGSARIIAHLESLPQVSAFFTSEAKQEEIDVFKKQLYDTGKVSRIEFISKKEALKIYNSRFKDDPLLLEFVTEETLPASFNIYTHKVEDLAEVARNLKSSTIVDEVSFSEDVVKNLTTWTNAIRKIGIALIAVLALDSIFLMVIIIGIKISQKKDEIEIMQLIGATNWYVRWPFVLEGIFYGIAGAIIGWILASGALLYASPYMASFLRGIPVLPVSWLFLVGLLGFEFVLAILLGFISSLLAVYRYLK